MRITYIRDPEDPDAVFMIPRDDAENWSRDYEVHTLEVKLRAFSLNEFFKARAEVQAEAEDRLAAVDEVIHKLIQSYDVATIESSSEGLTSFSELPLAIQMFIIGRVQRLLLGAVDLPFRYAAGAEDAGGKPKPRRKRV